MSCVRGMGLLTLGLCWVAAVGVVLGLLNYYKNPRTCTIPIQVVVFLGFLFPFSITFVLPIDVSSVNSTIGISPAAIV